MKELKSFSNSVEVYSIDEAFLGIESQNYDFIAVNIVKKIKYTTGIPVSVGVGKTKTLSKISASIAKKTT